MNWYDFYDFSDEAFDDFNPFTVEVLLAMSEEQAQREDCGRCISPPLPIDTIGKRELYLKLRDIDDRLCISKEIGWETVICLYKRNLPAVMDFLYNGQVNFDYKSRADKVEGDKIWIIGYDD